jgi:hypothetical protein
MVGIDHTSLLKELYHSISSKVKEKEKKPLTRGFFFLLQRFILLQYKLKKLSPPTTTPLSP